MTFEKFSSFDKRLKSDSISLAVRHILKEQFEQEENELR